MIVKVDKNIWIVEGNCVSFYGFSYPTRSVIVKLENNELWIWSPIELSQTLKSEVAAIGQPKHLVSPNKLHHLFLKEWAEAYPAASLWGPQSTIIKKPDLHFEYPLEHNTPTEWKEDIDQVWFNGSRAMDEIVFFHKPSRTVIMADLSENFSEHFIKANWSFWQRVLARLWGIVEGKGYAPLEWRLSFNREKTRQTKNKMLAWNPEKVIMAHGEWQNENGRAFLEKSFEWVK